MGLFEKIGIDGSYLVIILFIMVIGLFLYCISLKNLLGKYKKRLDILLQGSNGKSMEKSILGKFAELDKIKKEVEENTDIVSQLKDYSTYTFQKFALNKYDAFEGMGGKTSFSLCMLTDNNDGFVMTSVHNDIGGCFTYMKEIIRGESYVILSAEEKKALELAKKRRSCLDDE